MQQLSLLFSISVLLNGCSTIQVPVTVQDLPLYYLKEASSAEYATEFHFLTSGTIQIPQADWNNMSQGMVCTPLASWGTVNTEFGKFCTQVPCDYETTQLQNAITTRLEEVSGKIFH